MAIDPSKLVGVGTTANDNTGDPLRDAFVKINDNFTELYIEPSISLVGNILTLTRPDDSTSTVDLAPYLDDTAIVSASIDGAGIATFVNSDTSSFTLDLSSLLDDTNLITSVDGGTGLEVDTTTGDVTVSISDNGVDHDQLANRYTVEVTKTDTSGTGGSAVTLDWSTGAIFHFSNSLTGAIELKFDEYKANQVIDIYGLTGSQTVTLNSTASGTEVFKRIGTQEYDGTADNHIQVICLDDSASTPVFHYAIGTTTSTATA